MQQLPGYIREEALAVALSTEMASIAQQTIERALDYYRIHKIEDIAFRDLVTLVAGSLLQAGLSEQDWKQITAYGAQWFQTHPGNWATTIHSETGRVWLGSLKVPPSSLLKN